MGSYTTELIDTTQASDIIRTLRSGYTHDGVKHRSNYQVATIMLLQANLGCRIGDIVNLAKENIIFDGESWRLDMQEEKTGKSRRFVVPTPVKSIIDEWCRMKCIKSGRLFTVTEQAVWKQLRAVTAYLGMENVSAHSFRKSAAYRVYMDSGKDLALTAQYLNHSAPATTLLYLKRSNKQMDEVVSKSVVMA